MKPITQPSETASVSMWLDLDASCEAAVGLSEAVGNHLTSNAPASDVVPLLERQLQLTVSIRDRIAQVGESVTAGDMSPRSDDRLRDSITDRLRTLLELEDRNRRLLSRTGVKLHGPPSSARRPHPNSKNST